MGAMSWDPHHGCEPGNVIQMVDIPAATGYLSESFPQDGLQVGYTSENDLSRSGMQLQC